MTAIVEESLESIETIIEELREQQGRTDPDDEEVDDDRSTLPHQIRSIFDDVDE